MELKRAGIAVLFFLSIYNGYAQKQPIKKRPNIILLMADDLGNGDLGYLGNKIVKTPVLDAMAKNDVLFTRFYSAAPVCTPTRASCLTGRNAYRMNMTWASDHSLPRQEITIAEVLKAAGYATGHFGKWHVGDLSQTLKEGYAPGKIDPANYSPPWENGFDEAYTCYSSMPLYNPYYLTADEHGPDSSKMVMDRPVALGQLTGGYIWNMRVWTGPGQFVDEWLKGHFDKLVMEKAVDFIRRKSAENKPFLSLIWLTTPHTPVVAGNEHRALYPGLTIRQQHWYGALTAMDEQIGYLKEQLKKLNIEDNTIIWFCSDNGPSWVHDLNSSGGQKGKKGSLYEGGVHVPGILEYPGKFKNHVVINAPVSTSDFFPTLLSWAGVPIPGNHPLDGVDITYLINDPLAKRIQPIGFQSPVLQTKSQSTTAWTEYGGHAMSWLDNDYKLISNDDGKTWELYNVKNDRSESNNIAVKNQAVVNKMKSDLLKWVASCSASAKGADYK